MKRKKRGKHELPLIVATDERAAVVGLRMLARRKAYAVIYVEDREDGVGLSVRFWVHEDHEHRLDEVEAMVRRVGAADGHHVVDPGSIVTGRGAA